MRAQKAKENTSSSSRKVTFILLGASAAITRAEIMLVSRAHVSWMCRLMCVCTFRITSINIYTSSATITE